jgi:AhpC/TSA family
MRLLMLGVAAVTLWGQAAVQIKTGPAVGSAIPRFEAPDQNGQTQSLESVSGSKGTLLVFYRSADW